MAGYFGTETQQRLQAQADVGAGLIRATPGACQTGRILGCDDPELFGWERIDDVLQRDGVFGFRMIDAAKAESLRARLLDRSCRLDTWDVFLASKEEALPACQLILQVGLPEGLSELEPPSDPEGGLTARIQSLMAACGIAPFSGSMLTGECGPAATAIIADSGGNPVAAAHAYLPHNAFSRYHAHAWGGLVSVAQTQRGKGLGSFINARVIVTAFERLGASHVYELISAANLPSRRMAEACGLRHEAELVCGIAVKGDGGRVTR